MNAMTPGEMMGEMLETALVTPDLGAFGGISVRLSVEVGAVKMSLREVLRLQVGAVHALDRRVDQPVDVLINERLIARGEIVSIGDRFGVKLTEIVSGGAG
nr:FliM/FliN family flagellar motor switch protein [Polymorphobacter sp.]